VSLEAAEAYARLGLTADALNNARAVIEDAPDESFGRASDRFAIAAAQGDAARQSREARLEAGLTRPHGEAREGRKA
jgi:hypothetical protein